MSTTNVLFVCGDDSATALMAESILRAAGARFRAYSAGWRPAAAARPEVVEFLRARHLPVEGLAPKSYRRFVEPNGPRLDFTILLCDEMLPEPAPEWNGAPVVAHWGIDEQDDLRQAFWVLTRRIKIFTSLPHGRASPRAIQDRVHSIPIWQ